MSHKSFHILEKLSGNNLWKLNLPPTSSQNNNIQIFNFFASNGEGKTTLCNQLLHKISNKEFKNKTVPYANILTDQQLIQGEQHISQYHTIDLRDSLDDTFSLYPKHFVMELIKTKSIKHDSRNKSQTLSENNFECAYFKNINNIKIFSFDFSLPLSSSMFDAIDDIYIDNNFFSHMELISSLLGINIYSFSKKLTQKKFQKIFFDKIVRKIFTSQEKKLLHFWKSDRFHIISNRYNNKKSPHYKQKLPYQFNILHIYLNLIKNNNDRNRKIIKKTQLSNMSLKKKVIAFNNFLQMKEKIFNDIIAKFNYASHLKFELVKKYNSFYNTYFYDIHILNCLSGKKFSSSNFLRFASDGEKNCFCLFKLLLNSFQPIFYENFQQRQTPQEKVNFLLIGDDIFTSLDQKNLYISISILKYTLKLLSDENTPKKIIFLNFTHDINLMNFYCDVLSSNDNKNSLKNYKFFIDKFNFETKQYISVDIFSPYQYTYRQILNQNRDMFLFNAVIEYLSIREAYRCLNYDYYFTDSIFHLHTDPITLFNRALLKLENPLFIINEELIKKDIFSQNETLTIIFSYIFIKFQKHFSKNDPSIIKFKHLLCRKILDTLWLDSNPNSKIPSYNTSTNDYRYLDINSIKNLNLDEQNILNQYKQLFSNEAIHQPNNIFNYKFYQFIFVLEEFFDNKINHYNNKFCNQMLYDLK